MDVVEILKDYFNKKSFVEFAYLFGSFAREDFNNKSDIDLAILFKDDRLDNKLQIIHELGKKLKRDIDIVSLNSIKNLYLLEDILNNNVVLKDSAKRVDFELLKAHQILDYKEFKRVLNAS